MGAIRWFTAVIAVIALAAGCVSAPHGSAAPAERPEEHHDAPARHALASEPAPGAGDSPGEEPVSAHPRDGLTAKALAQLAAAERAVAPLATPAAARAAGYRPMFGLLPAMGEHYVNLELYEKGGFEVERPSVLIFSPVEGKPALVGVAYAFRIPVGAPMPEGFDGDADHWHTHPGLADLPGKQLVMVHAWFVPSPDGPFAGHNPWLPYLAVGLRPPPSAAVANSQPDRRARLLGLALWQVSEVEPFGDWVRRRGGEEVRQRVESHRSALRALVPELRAAQASGGRAEYERLADRALGHWSELEAAYRAVGGPLLNRVLDEALAEVLGESRGHGGHAGHRH